MPRRNLAGALAVVIAGAAALPGAHPVRAAADPVTVVVIQSEQGEFYGQGRTHTFVPPNTVEANGTAGSVQVHVANGAFDHQIQLATADGADLAVGAYEGATNATPGTPHLRFSLSSECSDVQGRFDILEAPTIGQNNVVTAFAAEFSFHCGSNMAMLYGSIRINSAVPIKALSVGVPNTDTIEIGTGKVMVTGTPVPVTVTNVGNESLSLDGVTHGRSVVTGLGTCGSSLDPGASCDVDVAYRPELAGETLSTVTVMTDAARWGVFFWAHGTATFDSGTNVSPATAILIDALPFGHGGLSPAQYEGSWNACPANYGSLWYRLKLPTKSRVELDPAGSQGPVQVMVMTGTSDSQPTICGDTTVTFTAEANVTYWIRVQAAYPGYQGQGIVLQAREAAPDVTVDASGFGVSVSTFYPIVDGYRDTVALKGTRFEKASVAISIYAPTGGKVRALSVATANGPWSVAWNGRTAAGTLLASGKYRIVQTVTDLWGNKLSATSYVTLSRKKLYTYTWSKTIDAGRYNAYGKSATGTISRTASSYAGGVKLATGTGTGSAAVGYAVTVPSATVYKTVTFQVLGRGNRLAGGIAETGVQDWTIGADWSVNNVDRWGAAPAEYGWAGIRVSGTHHVSNHVVRGYISVWVIGPGANKWLDARDVRFTVVYGVLK